MAGFLRSGLGSPTPEQIARNCQRLGWIGFWLQAVLGLIPLLVVLGLVLSRLGQWSGSLFSLGLWLAVLCLLFLVFSTYWSFRYTRLAGRLEVSESRPSKSGVKRALRIGLLANLAVMAIAVPIALWNVSQLTFRMLTVPQGGTVVTPNQAVTQGALVSPSNMLAIQAVIHAIAAAPTADHKRDLEQGFDQLFGRCFLHHASLNTVSRQFRAHKAELLRMLEVPQVPLHNNGAESDIREYVTRREISGGTRSEAGRRARDTLVGLKKTCRKLGISCWQFLISRLRGDGQIPPLPDVIRAMTSEQQPAASPA